MGDHIVSISEEYPVGRDGVDTGDNSPLYRGLSEILIRGKPGNRLFPVILGEQQPAQDHYHWLGALVSTKGNRLLFFPGTHCPFRLLDGTIKSPTPCVIDHLTLDDDRRGRHISSVAPKIHVALPDAPLVAANRVHWFTVHFSSTAFMHPFYARSELRFPVPSSDSERRSFEGILARENAPTTLVRLHSDARHWNHNHIGFTFSVGGSGVEHTTGVPSFPIPGIEIEKNAIRTHLVDIDGHTSVQVTAYCTSSYLQSEAMLFF